MDYVAIEKRNGSWEICKYFNMRKEKLEQNNSPLNSFGMLFTNIHILQNDVLSAKGSHWTYFRWVRSCLNDVLYVLKVCKHQMKTTQMMSHFVFSSHQQAFLRNLTHTHRVTHLITVSQRLLVFVARPENRKKSSKSQPALVKIPTDSTLY